MKKELNNQELFHFCEHFHLLLRSGISPLEGLELLETDSSSSQSKEIFSALAKDLEENGSLALALENSKLFPSTMTAYVRAGEETGCLDEVMESLAAHYEQEDEISRQIKSAVTYPLIMLGMMAAVIVMLLVKVLPVFQQVFRQMGMEMNGLSSGFLSAGAVISRYSALFLGIAAIFILLLLFLCLNPSGRAFLQKTSGKIPLLREIPISMDYSRLTQGISMGLRSGNSPDDSLAMAGALISHPQVCERVKKAAEILEQGESFSQALTDSQLFAGMEGRLISIGVHSGSLDEVMEKLSSRYRETVASRVSDAVSVIEPTIVILLSLLVGLVLLSVMVPLLGVLSEIIV